MPKRTVAAISITAVFISILYAVSVGAQQECPSPRLIDEITGTGDRQSPPFDTTTNLFKVSYQITATDPEASFFLDIDPAGDPSGTVGSVSQKGSQTGETFVNAPPGKYNLSVIAGGDTQYTLRVEECGEGQATPKEGTQTQGATQTKAAQPKSTTAPVQPAPPPPAQPKATPQPIPQPPPSPGPLLNAGGPKDGPVPRMPDGECPVEFPQSRSEMCHRS